MARQGVSPVTTPRIVTLLTDFGEADGYVAAMKGVLLSGAPGVRIIDAGHAVARHDVLGAAWALHQYAALYPRGTIHVAVVDPGVGTSRAALCARVDGRFFLAPDNGLLAWVVQNGSRVDVRRLRPAVHRPGGMSATFHGRDVFAHAAAILCRSAAAYRHLTEAAPRFALPAWSTCRKGKGRIEGEIVHVDIFGNAITSIRREDLRGAALKTVLVRPLTVRGLSRTYADVAPGRALALIGSSGHLEIAVNQGSAARHGRLRVGDPVVVETT
jgi:hypothetical protein